jgi:predicted transcriptional regulator
MENTLEFEGPATAQACSENLSAVEDAIYVIGGKWKLKIIIVLQDKGNIRFNDLQRNIPGISARVLSNELKDLELNGFKKSSACRADSGYRRIYLNRLQQNPETRYYCAFAVGKDA